MQYSILSKLINSKLYWSEMTIFSGLIFVLKFSFTFCLDAKSNKKVKTAEKKLKIYGPFFARKQGVRQYCSKAKFKLRTLRFLSSSLSHKMSLDFIRFFSKVIVPVYPIGNSPAGRLKLPLRGNAYTIPSLHFRLSINNNIFVSGAACK